ncbi:ATP-binding protein [Streptomyces sp. AJS327]|uniref:ATP-binding protein n=1 Tax=Streptomyces sp. AJS327 TaxID=2545265 RepID=UPI0015DFD13F|nr:ATP-binding protein [Streptomyces sp. AJS327]MBA0049745.1 ATP-binding protein [Streptomyces sp. AJS327]
MDCTTRVVGAVREVLSGALQGLGFDEDVCADSALTVSEIVANAAEHACGPYKLSLRRVEETWVCEVHDGDPVIPRAALLVPGSGVSLDDTDVSLLEERGRGLRIVHTLTNGSWGIRSKEGGKCVWFSINAKM